MREIIVAVDSDNSKSGASVRYTQRQRLKDIRSRKFAHESQKSMPYELRDGVAEMAGFISRSANLETFCGYCKQRRETLELSLQFYSDIAHRKRRWKTYIKTQKSEECLYKRLSAMHAKEDKRTMVLAYGSWGLVAGKTSACKKGNPATIGRLWRRVHA